jgi:hypothetical protein
MRLTVHQRLMALERETVILHDTVELLHKLLKEQQSLIHDYIVQKIGHTENADVAEGRKTHPAEAVYTFVCQRRFKRIEKNIQKLLKLVEQTGPGRIAG